MCQPGTLPEPKELCRTQDTPEHWRLCCTFQTAIPVIFKEIHGYNELEIGLAFLPGLAGMTIGGIVAGKLVDGNYAKTAQKYNVDVDRKKGDSLKDFLIEAARYRKFTLV
ncbi:hypothetical protein FGG08_005218 [Glutinoglossum americanum]|uniref:Uncharacterized protein n=1 Tax=Glutinoglossum americanum TaxID=1670608 RepID=A0A9P8I411_9PEZI|nr:hypothetical protein FGG08_005218 [Glutinoglossum americanum]